MNTLHQLSLILRSGVSCRPAASLANENNSFSKQIGHNQFSKLVIVIGMNKIQSLTELFWENAFECIGKVKWMKIYSRTKDVAGQGSLVSRMKQLAATNN